VNKSKTRNDQRSRRRASVRLRGYDYSSEGAYFVTINTAERECSLGTIALGEMHLSMIGEIVDECWLALVLDLPGVFLDVYQIMPNHLHGIIVLLGSAHSDASRDLINQIPTGGSRHQANVPSMGVRTGLTSSRVAPESTFPLMRYPKQTLGKVIRHFKAKATKRIHDAGFPDFVWQSRYHDRIIRNCHELDHIRRYIHENPVRWSSTRK
jgi:putative transposase